MKQHVESLQTMAETGVIHGRFQVLHNDHMKYLMAGKARCNMLVVGITNPDPLLTRKDDCAPGRDEALSNPLTYYERQILVREALCEAGVGLETFTIVPFPINFPDHYRYYVPMDALFFLTINDDWGRKKHATFQSLGLATHVLWEVPPHQKGISGSDVRQRMAAGKPWTHLVPRCVAKRLESWGIDDRLNRLGR